MLKQAAPLGVANCSLGFQLQAAVGTGTWEFPLMAAQRAHLARGEVLGQLGGGQAIGTEPSTNRPRRCCPAGTALESDPRRFSQPPCCRQETPGPGAHPAGGCHAAVPAGGADPGCAADAARCGGRCWSSRTRSPPQFLRVDGVPALARPSGTVVPLSACSPPSAIGRARHQMHRCLLLVKPVIVASVHVLQAKTQLSQLLRYGSTVHVVG